VKKHKLPGFSAEVAFYRTVNRYGFSATVTSCSGEQAVVPQQADLCHTALNLADHFCTLSGNDPAVCKQEFQTALAYCSVDPMGSVS
jgi:hypothetical protein